MLWTLLLACSPAPAPEAPAADAAPMAGRAVEGPWKGGDLPALAASGDAVHAIWLEGTTLRWAASADKGATWSDAETVATDVIAGDGGQALPGIELSGDVPMVAYASADRPWLAVRGHAGWEHRKLSTAEAGMGVLLDIALVGGRPLVVWLDTRRAAETHTSDVYAWWEGQEEVVYADGADGVCMCCRPAAGMVDLKPAVAFRDAEGDLREVRLAVRDGGWTDRGRVTSGGWSPGGCPADGPVFDGDQLVVSDARDGQRRLWKGDSVVPGDGVALQPRALTGWLAWVSPKEDGSELFAGGKLVAKGPRIEPGEPVAVGDEVWLPWQGERGAVVAVTTSSTR
jgi:hypothetical protein